MHKKRLAFVITIVVVLVGLLAGSIYLYTRWNKPLGPALAGYLSGQPTYPQPTLNATEVQVMAQLPTPNLEPTLQPNPVCGNTPILTVLGIGIDYGSKSEDYLHMGDDYLYGLADVIRIVRIDFTRHRVVVFTLDRNIWVQIPGIADHYGITNGMLNQAYFYGVPAMGYYQGAAGGAGLLAQTLDLNFGLHVDNYGIASMAAFVKSVDALGGIDVTLTEPVDGGDLGQFNAGTQHLTGLQALNLARIREGYSSLIRITDQDVILQGIYNKIRSPEVIGKIPQLIQILRSTLRTDLSPGQINDLVCLISKMDSSDLVFAEIPREYYKQSSIYSQDLHQDIFIWDIDFNIIRYYVNEFQNGQWP